MESFLPIFKMQVENIALFFENHGFLFDSIQDRKNISKLTIRTCSEYCVSEFKNIDGLICINYSYGRDNKLSLGFSYYCSKKTMDFSLYYYAKDHSLPILTDVPLVHSLEEGAAYMIKYFDVLRQLLEAKLMAKINDGTIDNHYYRIRDQFR